MQSVRDMINLRLTKTLKNNIVNSRLLVSAWDFKL